MISNSLSNDILIICYYLKKNRGSPQNHHTKLQNLLCKSWSVVGIPFESTGVIRSARVFSFLFGTLMAAFNRIGKASQECV